MAKSKKVNLEKKVKVAPEFDKVKPEQRVKSIKDGKVSKKKPKVKKEVIKAQAAEIVKDPETKKKLKDKKPTKAVIGATKAPGQTPKRDVVELGLVNMKNGIKKEIENNSNMAKNLFDEELRFGLNVVGVKIPVCPPHTRKITLKHSLYDQKPDVCFFIADSIPKKGDQDETARLFKEKLQASGIDFITRVMTLTQFKNDYNTHNMKLKLCHTYDVFLVESKIAEHVYAILGKHFIKKRKRPFQIDTKNEKTMKFSIDNALMKSTMKISPKSLISQFEIGTVKMENSKVVDNIMTAVEQLQEKWLGGWKNISRIYLRPMHPSKVSIPIYASAVNPNEVEVPVVAGAKQNRLEKLQKKLKKSELLNLDVKSKKIARNRIMKKKIGDATASGDAPQKPTLDKKKKKKSETVAESNIEATAEQSTEKNENPVIEEKVSKKGKKKIQSEEKLQANAVAEELEKKKKKKSQETPPAPEPEKKKKKKLKEVEVEIPEEPVKKRKAKELAVVEDAAPAKPEKKKKKSKSDQVEELQQAPPKAKNNKKAAVVTDKINTSAEKVQTKKIKAKKNKA